MQIIEAKSWKEVITSEPVNTSFQVYYNRDLEECQKLFEARWGYPCEYGYHFGTTYVMVARKENDNE